MSKRVISLGDLVLDVVMPARLPVQSGQHQIAAWQQIEPGGAGNFLFAAQHVGLDVLPVGAIGTDGFGTMILDLLRAEGIDTRYAIALPSSSSSVVLVLTDPHTTDHVFIGRFGQGPDLPYPNGLDGEIARAEALYMAGYTLAERRIVSLVVRAAEHARTKRIPVFLNVGPMMDTVLPDMIWWSLCHTDVVLAADEEIPLISEGRTGEMAYQYVLAQGPRVLVVRHGTRDCTVITRQEQIHVPGFDAPVTDTVGVGDCFAGAFVAGWLGGLSLYETGRLANAMSAAAVRKTGAGRNAPHASDVRSVLKVQGEDLALPLPC
ncbi:MAG TPA: carbohydrate kinase family protein [Aggregatilinea sp.]|jgi:ribokinase|uniref:carbohydrate kinase family protein n=1 Tax=Aggregatilinea sp. TaxID=2806333 RepID=UPI002CD3C0A1|nr:carbohydrate kinase family protein [Aggregatilinea sp.]HML23938.1 carbohydrate kinase family protein [Aggregatilinea sp.]